MADVKIITEGVATKIKEVFGPLLPSADFNKDIIYIPEDLALRKRAEMTAGANKPSTQDREKYHLEFISFWLENVQFSWERQRTPLARTGLNVGLVSGNTTQYRIVKAVPVDFDFSITLWTHNKIIVDNFIKEYCFLQQDNPQIEFYWEGDKKFEIDFFIRPMIAQEDTVSKMFVDGKYWKPKIGFKVEGWLVKDVPIAFAKTINLDIYSSNHIDVQDDNTLVYSETVTSTI